MPVSSLRDGICHIAFMGHLTSYFSPESVVVSSPLALNECDKRLQAATDHQGSLWYLRSENIGRADPKFRGRVDSGGIAIARFDETLGRNSFVPFLEGTLATGPNGATELRGSVGLNSNVRVMVSLMTIVGSLIAAAVFVTGIVLLAQGHGLAAVPALLIPLVIVGFGSALVLGGMKSLRGRVEPLLSDVQTLLDSRQPARRKTVT